MPVWDEAMKNIDCDIQIFNTHQVRLLFSHPTNEQYSIWFQIYPDSLIPDLAAAISEILGKPYNDIMQFFGHCFVRFFSNFGWACGDSYLNY